MSWILKFSMNSKIEDGSYHLKQPEKYTSSENLGKKLIYN